METGKVFARFGGFIEELVLFHFRQGHAEVVGVSR